MDKLSVFLPNLRGGGAERVTVNLIKGFLKKGIRIDLILMNAEGEYLNDVPKEVRIVDLKVKRKSKSINSIIPLMQYLKKERPTHLMAHMNSPNIIAIIAKKLAMVDTYIIAVEHNTVSQELRLSWKNKIIFSLMKIFYPSADKIIAVSKGSAEDLKKHLCLKVNTVEYIYNPVYNEDILIKASDKVEHEWFNQKEIPVIVSIGRLTEQKDYKTLLKAMSLVCKSKKVYLAILGEGVLRQELTNYATELGIQEYIWMPGFVSNPYAYLKKSSVFVLSSLFEGLPTVLIEALACGCTIVSTDCPSGPKEIIGDKYGYLVPIRDYSELAKCIQKAIVTQIDKTILLSRAKDFGIHRAVDSYIAIIASGEKKC